jgi:hypothetical protein
MKWLLRRDIWPRVVLAVAILAVLAYVAGRRQEPEPAPVAASAARTSAGQRGPVSPAESVADLDLENLKRPRAAKAIGELFVPAPVAPTDEAQQPPPPPAAPATPPLPFTYAGKIIEGDRTVVFLARGDQEYTVEAGQTIEKLYRVEQVTETAVTFTYLPLRTRQTLSIQPLN